MRWREPSRLILITQLLSLYSWAASPQPLSDLVNSSDAIVIADFNTIVANGTRLEATFTVIRTLKGSLLVGALARAHYAPEGKAQRVVTAVPKERAMLFLHQESPGVWAINDSDPQGGGFRSAYFAVSANGPAQALSRPGASIIDEVVRELAAAVDAKDGDFRAARQLMSISSAKQSSITLETYQTWTRGSSGPLRVLGLAGLAGTGDPQAVVSLASEHEILVGSPVGIFASGSFYSFRKPQPEAVRALGGLATSSSLRREIQSAAIRALGAIHSRDALPFFYVLLNNPDALTRELAMGGFSSFVTNMRISEGGLDGAEALDEVMNPGRKRTSPNPAAPYDTPETRKFLHFGRFRDSSEEGAYIAFWKSWYERNRAQLGL